MSERTPASLRWTICWATACGPAVVGCHGVVPSERVQGGLRLPIPALLTTDEDVDRLSSEDHGLRYRLSPRTLIPIAFDCQPDISSSYERFKSEEARYDFFYVSRDSLTPTVRVSNRYDEGRVLDLVTRDRDHTVRIGLEKRFFDTTELDVSAGYRTVEQDDEIGNQPFASVRLRYPLWVSREKLERTSEDIFRRNELDDAQLAYIQEARSRLQRALFRFYLVMDLRRRVGNVERWRDDLRALRQVAQTIVGRDVVADLQRLDAEIARVAAEVRIVTGRYDIDLARFIGSLGIPFHARVELIDEPFNPFEGGEHSQLLALSIETDPEIATLRNAMRNAEVQLDLARRGKWDLALLMAAESNFEGRGEDAGVSDWSVSVGVDFSAIDTRVTRSLMRQAQASIHRFRRAITARENVIYVETLEPLVRIETIGASLIDLTENLPRYTDDYEKGVVAYLAASLNIDNLLTRRETVFQQDEQISRLKFLIGANVSELCAATGKFFELLGSDADSGDRTPKPVPPS